MQWIGNFITFASQESSKNFSRTCLRSCPVRTREITRFALATLIGALFGAGISYGLTFAFAASISFLHISVSPFWLIAPRILIYTGTVVGGAIQGNIAMNNISIARKSGYLIEKRYSAW